jgi:FKBP-type peptidyl-prolyl cis-trans isomerase SlyD
MTISNDKVVSLTYELKVDGQVVDRTGEEQPLVFLYGAGQMIPGFEKQLNGLSKGESYGFQVSAEEGYGESNPEELVELSKDIFVVDGQLVPELKQDALIPMADQHGNQLRGRVAEIKLDTVTMDFNHPLAGKELNFTGKILDVREATQEEIEHGHVHGDGGHHH